MSMHRAYDVAAHAVRARYAAEAPDLLAGLDALRRDDVQIVKGAHDAVQRVMRALGVPCRVAPIFAPKRAAIVFGNCGWTPRDPDAVRAWVDGGGWLVTSDWALEAVSRAFPGTIRRKAGPTSSDEVVSVEPGAESAFADVVVLGCDPQWWLEASSYPIEILDPERVRVEAASHELLVRFGAPAVATRFDWGAGHVYHVISHFWLKKTRTADARHAGSGADFLREGMRLSPSQIDAAFAAAKVAPDAVNYASIQSAVTSTELITRLCVDAIARRDARADAPRPTPSFWQRLFG